MIFKYCPLCKKNLLKKTNALLICTSCNFRFYINPKPTTIIFLEKDNKILLVKRARAPKKAFWDAPGGFIEQKETAEESAKREIKEELNLNIYNLSYIGSFTGNYLYQGINYTTLGIAFKAKVKDWKKLKFNKEEITKIYFFSKQKIPWKKIAFKDVKDALNKLISSF